MFRVFSGKIMNLAPNHCADVLAGCYDLQVNFDPAPTVLDIGANVGAYCQWAAQRWPGCRIIAYEPNPENFAALTAAVKEIRPAVKLHEAGVLESEGTRFLYDGKNNCGECSFFDLGEQLDTGHQANVVAAATLPRAQVLKIDAEGAELPILRGLRAAGRITQFLGISLEFHGAADRRRIDELLEMFTLMTCQVHHRDRGILNYVRSDLLKAQPK